MLEVTPSELAELIASPFADEAVAGDDAAGVVVVHATTPLPDPGSLPVVICCIGATEPSAAAHADVLVDGDDRLTELVGAIGRAPLAATALAVLLRTIPSSTVEAGLAAESAVYSLLQAGPEFAAWRDRHVVVPDPIDEPTVLAERIGDELHVTLHRPHRHNAISTRLRDELCATLAIAVADPSVERVVLRGAGPSFCSGGDLHEFGSRPDPSTAHHTRLARSPARLVHALTARTTVHVHGAALGGGIEMAAFAGHVVAHPDTAIGLPEISLGLIPGAGGTVSITRRIGRHRTALLALTGRSIDARTALAWGLVDELAG